MATTARIKPLAKELDVVWEYVEIGTCMVPRHVENGCRVMDRADALRAMAAFFKRKATKNAEHAKKLMDSKGQKDTIYRKNAFTWHKRYLRALELLRQETGEEIAE